MRFLDLLPAERVRSDLAATDKTEVLEQLAVLLAGDDDVATVREALASRERLGSTGLGHGVAVPHGRSPAQAQARAAFVRLAHPIDFGAADGTPVDLVAALIVPAHFTDQHLMLLAELAEMFSDPRVCHALRRAPGALALREELAKSFTDSN